jgi:outer membrane protein assembly factor BamE (lipoprotein component of BamABCDE complex)
MSNHIARTIALIATVALLQGCAAVLASNEPYRNALIPQLQQGMTREQVETVIGKPDQVMVFNSTQTVSWDYRYTDSWGFLCLYAVNFGADWRVVSMVSRRLNDGRSGMN